MRDARRLARRVGEQQGGCKWGNSESGQGRSRGCAKAMERYGVI